MVDETTFHLRINGGEELTMTVKTSVYWYAAAAVPAMFDPDKWPIEVEIWVPSLLPEHGPFYYIVHENEYGAVVTSHAVPEQGPPTTSATP